VLTRERAVAIHAVAHDLDFSAAFQAARQLGLAYHLSVHDDLEYALRGRPELERGREALAEAWAGAAWRFVISPAMGEEYSRRYGSHGYSILTDGVANPRREPRPVDAGRMNVYFMGLIHLSYESNFLSLLGALARLHDDAAIPAVACICRSGSIPLKSLNTAFPIELLPLGSEQDVERDLDGVDLLYLPLPFDAEHDALVRYSLSTKLVTYLGSGLPIVYHGPAYGAAYELLSTNRAALLVTSLDQDALVEAFRTQPDRRAEAAANALGLTRKSFVLDQQRETFWQHVIPSNGRKP
jgi:hypothetical protein